MRYYLDCEFIESGHREPIDLISIGLVCQDGRTYYAINYDCDWSKANDWVRQNVLSQLPEMPLPQVFGSRVAFNKSEPYQQGWRNRGLIADEILDFCNPSKYGKPEFWGEWCSYDWVVFCQMFGTMMDLPKGFPMRCRDIIQLSEDVLDIPATELPNSLEVPGNHNALLGAKTVEFRYDWLQKRAELAMSLVAMALDELDPITAAMLTEMNV